MGRAAWRASTATHLSAALPYTAPSPSGRCSFGTVRPHHVILSDDHACTRKSLKPSGLTRPKSKNAASPPKRNPFLGETAYCQRQQKSPRGQPPCLPPGRWEERRGGRAPLLICLPPSLTPPRARRGGVLSGQYDRTTSF